MAHDRFVDLALAQAGDVRAVELQELEIEVPEVAERRVARPEVVERKADAELPTCCQRRPRGPRISNERGFRELEVDEAWVHSRELEADSDIVDEVRVSDLARRHVCRDAQWLLAAGNQRRPTRGLPARLFKDSTTDGHDQSGVFERAQEVAGRDHSAPRVVPAQKPLTPDDSAAAQCDDRLEQESELTVLEGSL